MVMVRVVVRVSISVKIRLGQTKLVAYLGRVSDGLIPKQLHEIAQLELGLRSCDEAHHEFISFLLLTAEEGSRG